MNITFFIGGLSGGGAERVVCNLANFLSQNGNMCSVLTMSQDQNSYGLRDDVVTESLLLNSERKNLILNYILRFVRLYKRMKNNKCDAYVIFLPITTILFLLLRQVTDAKVIVSERADPSRYQKWIQFLLRKLAKRADMWVFQTEDARAWYGDTVKNSVVIPNAINPAFIKPMYDGERRKVIVGAGRLNAQKNFALLINAFADIAAEFPDYSLTIYGEGSKRGELEQLAQERGIADRVSLPGYVKSLGDEIQDASLFVLSSDFEGMPNALMEAMALGLPCISTDCPVGGPKYLIKHEENGMLVSINDQRELSIAISTMLNHKEKASEMGLKAHDVSTILNPEKIYGQWREIIEEK